MVIGQSVQHGDGHPLPNHQQQSDRHIMVALVVMELGGAFQNLQYDVNHLLLKHSSLWGSHTWGRARNHYKIKPSQKKHPKGKLTFMWLSF